MPCSFTPVNNFLSYSNKKKIKNSVRLNSGNKAATFSVLLNQISCDIYTDTGGNNFKSAFQTAKLSSKTHPILWYCQWRSRRWGL